jgi:hypothetical protein
MLGTYFVDVESFYARGLVASHATDLVRYVNAVRRYSRLMLAYQWLIIIDACISRTGYPVIHLLEVDTFNQLFNHHSFYLLNIVPFFCIHVKPPLRRPSLDGRISFVCTVQRWATQYWEIPHMAFVAKHTLMAASVTTS